LKAQDGEIIGTSERSISARSVEKGIASVKKNALDARADDLAQETTGAFTRLDEEEQS
jgi:uncharacterized protein YegP (UPF0339 family)